MAAPQFRANVKDFDEARRTIAQINEHFRGAYSEGASQAAVSDPGLTFSASPTQAECEALYDFVKDVNTLVGALRSALVQAGTIKGSA